MKGIIVKTLGLMLALGLTALSGCGVKTEEKADTAAGEKIYVYSSFYAMYDMANKIGGDKIRLANLVPAGTEPHDWEPSPNDIANLEKAGVLIYNGAGMEQWVDKVLNSISNKKLIAVDTSREVKLLENTDGDEDLKYDPHVWLNPMNAKKQMEAIKNALASADPANKDYYEKNYAENAKRLDALDLEYKEAVSGFAQKNIIVAHQAFGYICEAYGLKQVPIEGLSAESEPSPARMAEITEFVKDNNVKYIFYEELISPKVAQAIARETGAKTAVLNPLEGLEENDIKAGKEYFSVMRENLEALKKAQ